MAGQDTISWLCPAQEAWGMSMERPGRVGTDGTRRGRTDGAWWRRPDRTGWRVSDVVGLGEYVTVVVLFGWARGTRRQLGRFERVDHVHLREDWRRRDEIELPLLRERLHFGCIKFGELRLWQVIHNPGTKWVANDIDGGTHSVTEWTNGISVSEWNDVLVIPTFSQPLAYVNYSTLTWIAEQWFVIACSSDTWLTAASRQQSADWCPG